MPRRRLLNRAPLLAAPVALVLTGCGSSTLTLPEPSPAPSAAAVCDGLLAHLPTTVAGRSARPTTPGHLTRAWGDPPVTLTCGLAPPTADDGDGRCFEVNGVGWKATPGTGGLVFTTWQRRATVQVGVPEAVQPQADALVDLSAAITAHDPATAPCT